MSRVKFILLLMLTMPFLTGFSGSKSKVDFVQGIWKCEVPNNKGYISFLEIGKDYIVFHDYDGYREDGLILEETEGVVLVRKAGMGEIISRIIMRDDEHIIVELPGRKMDFIRSSAEEKNNIFKPPVANIMGLYQSQDGTMLFEFSESIVVKNGVSLDVSLFSEDQMYFAVSGGIPQFALTPIEDGRLLYRDRPGGLAVILVKVPQEEANAIKARLSVQIPGAEPPPEPMDLAMVPLRRPPRRERQASAQPTFRSLGGASTATGGAPPRRVLTGRQVSLFDDPYMILLRDRYPEYMTKLGRILQQSLNRIMLLYPSYYGTGQARLLFRIAADGVIEWYETQYPVDGSDNTLRTISERTLLEAGSFDPPTSVMLADPAFRQMSLTVYIYQ